jgi:DNA-binding XRE family transcriptional regulator
LLSLAAPSSDRRRCHANLGRAASQDDGDVFALIWSPTSQRTPDASDAAILIATAAPLRTMPNIAYVRLMLTPNLCREARSLLQWAREQLAKEAGLGITTVTAFEVESRQPTRSTIAQLTGALEAAGIMFVPDSNGGTNVALRK